MPNPKSGTVVPNLKVAIKEAKSGSLLEYRAEGEGDLQATIGNAEFTDAKILENLKFLAAQWQLENDENGPGDIWRSFTHFCPGPDLVESEASLQQLR